MNKRVRITSDEYLHKDFHGAISLGFIHLRECYGKDLLKEYWERLGRTCYRDLVEDIKERGLEALADHWKRIFTAEDGKFSLRYDGDVLVLEVHECPALSHMRSKGYVVDVGFCEHTEVVNSAICREAGHL